MRHHRLSSLLLLLPAILLLLRSPVLAVMEPCSPVIEGCNCDVGVLQCMGVHCVEFPTTPPEGVTEFIFEDCHFSNAVTEVPYTHAVNLIINNSVSYPDTSKLQIMDGAFAKLSNLSTLELRLNTLEIRAAMFDGLSHLKVLSLVGNHIPDLPENAFAYMPALQQLQLSANAPLRVPLQSFAGLDELRILELDNCGLTEVPVEAIKDLTKLRVLNLGHNDIQKVPAKAFVTLEELQELNLNSCGLEELEEDALDDLENLIVLDLSNNQLTEMDEHMLEASADMFRRLFVNDNQLTVLPDDLVPWNMMLEMRMENNRWMCDCSNAWMQSLHRNAKENLTCSSPAEVAGHDLHNVTAALDCPALSKSTIVMAVVIPLMVICSCIIVYLVYKLLKTRRRRVGKRNVRYSSVYKDTVETVSGGGGGCAGGSGGMGKGSKAKPMSEL